MTIDKKELTPEEALENIRVILKEELNFPINLTMEYEVIKNFINKHKNKKQRKK